MVIRRHVLAACASAAALVAALATGVSPGLAAQTDVSFSFETAQLTMGAPSVGHSPTGAAPAADVTSGSDTEGLGALSPKGSNGHQDDNASAPGGGNSVNESDASGDTTPVTS